MPTEKQVDAFVAKQKSIQFYKKVQVALKDVLLAMPDKEYRVATKNLIMVVLHEGALGQVMHFPESKTKFQVMQLTFPKKIPLAAMRFVVAHEFGHVMQGRNWQDGDGMSLEEDADAWATKWGFKKTKKIAEWMDKYAKQF